MNYKNFKIGIVASEFNKEIVDNLISGCLIGLKEQKISKENIKVYRVPGAFEIPLMAKRIIKKFDCLIALGCVIKGETDHYDQICRACVDGIMKVQLENKIPVIFEVLMVKKEKYAKRRSSMKKLDDNKGYVAAFTAIEFLKTIIPL